MLAKRKCIPNGPVVNSSLSLFSSVLCCCTCEGKTVILLNQSATFTPSAAYSHSGLPRVVRSCHNDRDNSQQFNPQLPEANAAAVELCSDGDGGMRHILHRTSQPLIVFESWDSDLPLPVIIVSLLLPKSQKRQKKHLSDSGFGLLLP